MGNTVCQTCMGSDRQRMRELQCEELFFDDYVENSVTETLKVRDMYYYTENYQTGKIVSKGGMGVLYRCTSIAEPHRRLIVKVLKKSESSLSKEL